jgi:diaminopimelate epimerase
MLRFTKMNGAGNDFVMIDNRDGTVRLGPEQIEHICDRHRGVGADGILLLEKGSNGADFRMRYYNRDGGEAEMCGNGARCFARFASKIANAPAKISFQTPAGLIRGELHGDLVTLQMSEPKDLQLGIDLTANGAKEHVHFINSGVPHVIVPVSKVEDVDVRGRGQALRRHEKFSPAGANVNFIEKAGPKKILVRTYERGVEDETLACGTGVVASALIFAASEKVDGPIGVTVRSGSELSVDFKRAMLAVASAEAGGDKFTNVTLTGPAEFAFEGTIEI